MPYDAMITDIQRFCLHDGPGIRTTVFFQGCNLRCRWCHNPETIPVEPVLLFYKNRCVGCGQCASACPSHAIRVESGIMTLDRSRCIHCHLCVKNCPGGALVLSGRAMNMEEIEWAILRDIPFYERGGGVTLSGGEPMLQFGFIADLLPRLRAHGVHTALDTAGCQPFDLYRALMKHVNLFLIDYKVHDPVLHKQVTGVDNTLIRENLRAFIRSTAQVWVRVPVIPGVNDNHEELSAIARDIFSMNFSGEIELIPFHRLGQAKYDSLGRTYTFADVEAPGEESMRAYRDIFASTGLRMRPYAD